MKSTLKHAIVFIQTTTTTAPPTIIIRYAFENYNSQYHRAHRIVVQTSTDLQFLTKGKTMRRENSIRHFRSSFRLIWVSSGQQTHWEARQFGTRGSKGHKEIGLWLLEGHQKRDDLKKQTSNELKRSYIKET